jgi:hypothetical protein
VKGVRANDVTLGDRARAVARRHGIPHSAVRIARSLEVSTHETPECLVVIGTLPDRRCVRMWCSPDQPSHVISLRLT